MWLPVLLLVVGLCSWFHPVLLSGFERSVTDLGDSRFNHYLLEHAYQWMIGNPAHAELWSPPFFYPQKEVLAYSDIMAGFVWFYAPFRFVGIPEVPSFALWMMTACLLTFGVCWQLFRRGLELPPAGSAIGAFLFTFGVPRAAQLGHQQLLPGLYVLAAVSGVVMLGRCASAGDLRFRVIVPATLLACGGCVLQMYSAFYPLWFTLFGLLVLALVGMLGGSTRQDLISLLRSRWLWVVAGMAVIAMLPALRLYLGGLDVMGARREDAVESMLPRLRSWIFLGEGHVLYGRIYQNVPWLADLPMSHEHRLGVGPVTTVLALAGLWRLRGKPWGRALLITSLVIFAATLFLYPGFHPWFAISGWIPGASALRAVARVGLLLLLPLSIGVAWQVSSLKTNAWKVVVILVVLAEQWVVVPTYDARGRFDRVREMAAEVKRDADAFYLVRQTGRRHERGSEYRDQIDAMWVSILSGVPTVNGYSGLIPPGWESLYFNFIRGEKDVERLDRSLEGWALANGADPAEIQMLMTAGSDAEDRP